MALLEVEEVSKSFRGLRAVARASFAVERHTIAALIGPNGAGKTTLFNLIAGLHRPDAGAIRFTAAIGGLPPHRVCAAGVGGDNYHQVIRWKNILPPRPSDLAPTAGADPPSRPQAERRPAPRGVRRRHALHADLRPLGPAHVLRAGRRPLQGRTPWRRRGGDLHHRAFEPTESCSPVAGISTRT